MNQKVELDITKTPRLKTLAAESTTPPTAHWYINNYKNQS